MHGQKQLTLVRRVYRRRPGTLARRRPLTSINMYWRFGDGLALRGHWAE